MGEKTGRMKGQEGEGEDENQGKEGNYLRKIDRVVRLGDGVMESAIGTIRILGGAVMVMMDKSLG